MSLRNVVLAAGLAMAAAAAPAQADVILNFNQVGPATGGAPAAAFVNVTGQIVVSDEAALNGFRFTLLPNVPSTYAPGTNPGLIGLQFYRGFGGPLSAVTTADFTTVHPIFADNFNFLSVSGSSATGLIGQIRYSDLSADYRFTFSGQTFTGTFSADGAPGCECGFSGPIVTTVPEPASIALFGAGLLGLAAVRRKRSA